MPESNYQNFLYPAGSSAGSGGSGSGGANTRPPTLRIGTVQTLEPTESATASITGSGSDYTLNLGLPKGATGAIGPKGEQGPKGADGAGAGGAIAKTADAYKEYQSGYVTRPADMENNTWRTITFDKPFAEAPTLLTQPVLEGPRFYQVRNVTATGYEVLCNYVSQLTGWYYEAFVPKT
mgnify:CR=1 FL=1|jgi:hypothetical protein